MSKNIEFLKLDLQSTISLLISDLKKRNSASYFLINSYSISMSNSLPNYRHILEQNNRNLIDSKIIQSILSIVEKENNYHQIRGIDLTREILRVITEEEPIYILGGSVENLQNVINLIRTRYPTVQIAGAYSPPFEANPNMNLEDILFRISNTKAKLVFVGLGTPKQDLISYEIARRLGKVVISIGAALDFFTNRIPECPKWIQRLGLEWLYRLLKEPRRLWKRYLVDSPKILFLLLKKDFRL